MKSTKPKFNKKTGRLSSNIRQDLMMGTTNDKTKNRLTQP